VNEFPHFLQQKEIVKTLLIVSMFPNPPALCRCLKDPRGEKSCCWLDLEVGLVTLNHHSKLTRSFELRDNKDGDDHLEWDLCKLNTFSPAS